MAADDLETQRAKASATIVWPTSKENTPVSAPQGNQNMHFQYNRVTDE